VFACVGFPGWCNRENHRIIFTYGMGFDRIMVIIWKKMEESVWQVAEIHWDPEAF
jgi:hypothetical protein